MRPLDVDIEARLHPAWAAGLFDGEGSVSLTGDDRLLLQLKMTDEVTVRRFCDAVGFGKVYGPYKNRTGEKDGYPRSDFHVWVARGENANGAWAVIWPWLSDVRRNRMAELTAALA